MTVPGMATDPRTGEDWTSLQFLQAIREDLGLIRGVLDIPDGDGDPAPEEPEGPPNLCVNPRLLVDDFGWSCVDPDNPGSRVSLPNGYAYQIPAYANQVGMWLPALEAQPETVYTVMADLYAPAAVGAQAIGYVAAYAFSGGVNMGPATLLYNGGGPNNSNSGDGEEDWWDQAMRVCLTPPGTDELRVQAVFRATGGPLGGSPMATNVRYYEGDHRP